MGHRVVSAQQYPRIPLIARQLRSRRFPGPGLRALVARASNPPPSAKHRGIGAAVPLSEVVHARLGWCYSEDTPPGALVGRHAIPGRGEGGDVGPALRGGRAGAADPEVVTGLAALWDTVRDDVPTLLVTEGLIKTRWFRR